MVGNWPASPSSGMIPSELDRAGDRAAPAVRVALGQVDRQPLVQPAGREVVRVLDRRVEDEVGELVRDDRADPGCVDLVGGDQGEHRPDVCVGLAADVLAGAGSQGIVERRLVGVDVEVDGLGLGDPEQGGGVVDPLLADRERLPPELLRALVPVDADDRAGHGLPVEARVGVQDRRRRAETDRPRLIRDPPLGAEARVRDEVAVALGERVGQGRRLSSTTAPGPGSPVGRSRPGR